MPLLDLSLVTETLIRLLRRYISQPHVWGMRPGDPLPTVAITGDPPDLLAQQTEDYALGIYLYHVAEDPYGKNLPEPPGSSPPVRFCEMGLQLYYLLTAHGGNRRETRPYQREQRLMGLALKALHDYPVVGAATTIGSDVDPHVFPDILRGEEDEFRLTLHPAPAEELSKIWTAASTPLRLSAVYQVDVVLLQAEEPAIWPVPVLVPKIAAGGLQGLWIRASVSDCTFTLPGESRVRTLNHSPALVAVGENFRLLGAGLSAPDNRVWLTRPDWHDPPALDVTDWVCARQQDDAMTLQIHSPVAGREISPGLYQVSVQGERGQSNFSPLAVAPYIDPPAATPPGLDPDSGPVASLVQINGGPFAGTDISSLSVLLGTQALRQVTTAPTPAEFRLVSSQLLELRVPLDLDAGHYAVRVSVNGVSTLPTRWFEVTV